MDFPAFRVKVVFLWVRQAEKKENYVFVAHSRTCFPKIPGIHCHSSHVLLDSFYIILPLHGFLPLPTVSWFPFPNSSSNILRTCYSFENLLSLCSHFLLSFSSCEPHCFVLCKEDAFLVSPGKGYSVLSWNPGLPTGGQTEASFHLVNDAFTGASSMVRTSLLKKCLYFFVFPIQLII